MVKILSNKDLLEQWKKDKKTGEQALSNQHQAAAKNHAYFAGDQMTYNTGVIDKDSKQVIVFNKIKPFVTSVAGFMIQLRRKPSYQAKIKDNNLQTMFSEYLNSFSDYVRENANLDHIESIQDKEMLITGYGAIDTNITYEKNPDGEIIGEAIKYNDIFWDPEAYAQNILDARWVFRRKKFTLDEALTLFQGSTPEDFEEANKDLNRNFEYNPGGGEYNKIAYNDYEQLDLVSVYYYQWWEREKYYRVKNPVFEMQNPAKATAILQLMEIMRDKRAEEEKDDDVVEDIFAFDPRQEFLTMNSTIYTDIRELFSRFEIEVDFVEHLRKIYYTAIISDNTVFKKFKSPSQDGFTIKFKTADYDHHNRRWFGMVDSLMKPAQYASKSLTEILFVIASNSKGGVMYEKSAVENPQRFEQQWATTKGAIRVEDGAISGNKIAPKAQAALPSGYENVYQISNESLAQVSGINPEFLGSSEKLQVSGALESLRIKQVITRLAGYFDSISLYQKEHARLNITFMRMLAENSSNRLFRILGKDGVKRFEELSEDNFAQEYDVEIGEVPDSATQKQEQSQIVLGFINQVAQMGNPNLIPLAIDYLPINQADKMKFKEALAPKEQTITPEQQQMQQQMQQLILQGQQADIARTLADAEQKQASANEKNASTTLKRAETNTEILSAEQKDLENDYMKNQQVDNFNIII